MRPVRGKSGETDQWSIPFELWLIRPSQEDVNQKKRAEAARRLASELELAVEEVKTEHVKGFQGRKTRILAPEQFRKLYVRCHRAHVLVLVTAAVTVLLDPELGPDKKNIISLESALANKAAFVVLSRVEELAGTIPQNYLPTERDCNSHTDPRCLPMHAFAPFLQHDLSTESGRRSFITEHRRSSSRSQKKVLRDAMGREWQVDPSMHSADSLHVRGHRLPVGFHWDVKTGRRKSVFSTGWQKWITVNEKHLNVHPDGFVRAPHAELVWSWDRPGNKRMPRR
jgi:hypothetical protein